MDFIGGYSSCLLLCLQGMLLPCITVLLAVTSVTSLAAQNKSAVDQWIQKNFEAVTIYREGDVARALELLGTMTLEEQEKSIGAIRGQMEHIAEGWPPRKTDVVPWTPRLLRGLGALQMEAAIAARASKDRDASVTADAHLALAKDLFNLVYFVTKENDLAAARWLLAMGLEQMAEATFSIAYSILIPACADYEDYAPLLVACGSIHETYGSFPADNGLPLQQRDTMRRPALPGETTTLSYAVRGLGRARASRTHQLSSARKYFERAIALNGDDNEAPLRLANVRMRLGDDQDAAQILEKLIARPSLDARVSYFARLFLTRVRDRQNRLEDAAALLAKAPATQSALIARAHNAARRGNARDAAILAEQAALSKLDDPWWGYRFGQYWIPSDLYKELREEARK